MADMHSILDDWWPERPVFNRRGRSQAGYTYARAATGPIIQSQHPYAFLDTLMHENDLVMRREDEDPIYRGDVMMANACGTLPAGRAADDEVLTPTDVSEDEEEAEQRYRSPSINRASVTAVAPSSPAVERLSSPETPVPRRLTTYLKRDKKRVHDAREAEARHDAERDEAEAQRDAERKAEAKRALRRAQLERPLRRVQYERGEQVPTRRSRRLGQVRLQGRADAGVYTAEKLASWGHEVHPWEDNSPRPLIDKHGKVMVVVAGAPKGDEVFWGDVIDRAIKDTRRLLSRGEFGPVAREQFVQFGTGFGELYAAPHILSGTASTNHEISHIQTAPAFNAISAYHNHLHQQFAPTIYAQSQYKVDELSSRRICTAPFPNSVFTTAEINFCDAPGLSRKNADSAFGTMEAITSLGFYNHKKGGQCEMWDDEAIIELAPGATIVFPAGTKRFSFMPVGKHETRYLFRQFCHAGVFRWFDKGGRSDAEFDRDASPEEIAKWEQMRLKRGQAVAKTFSRLDDISVL
ncbi:hypothetical protein C8R43DRAFT_1137629 [Mycena crocata]|nr:hypothetical protein C8R43DRAFT_1137629 [Mycena crocata]